MKKILMQCFIFLVTIGLIGCASQTRKQNTGIGVVIGAAMGGFTGNPVFMFPLGIMAGMAGYMMESSDDKPKYEKLGGDEKLLAQKKTPATPPVKKIISTSPPVIRADYYPPRNPKDSSQAFEKSP